MNSDNKIGLSINNSLKNIKFHIKHNISVILIALSTIFVSLLTIILILTSYLSIQNKNKNTGNSLYTTSQPTPTITSVYVKDKLTKNINEINGIKATLRYIDNKSTSSETSRNVGIPAVVKIFNLETKISKIESSKDWIFSELSPSGNYLVGRVEEESQEGTTDMGGVFIPKKTLCNMYVLNINSNKIYKETLDGGCAGPLAYDFKWLDGENYVAIGSGVHTLVSLPGMKKLVTYPSKGYSKEVGQFSFDKKYLVYDVASGFFDLSEYYPSFGILQLGEDSATFKKVFEVGRKESNSFFCWKGHTILFTRNYYDNSTETPPHLAWKYMDVAQFLYNVDRDTLQELCRGDTCKPFNQSDCDQIQNTNLVKNDIRKKISDDYGLIISDWTQNVENNLIAFSATHKNSEAGYDYTVYVYVFDSNTDTVYKIGNGEQPRWIYSE